jgi:poly-beta-1,6-N-acetyl-D-glucosamine synthase
MHPEVIQNVLILLAIAVVGPNCVFWSFSGLMRFVDSRFSSPKPSALKYSTMDVAVVIAAHNEELALPSCLAAILKLLPAAQIFIGNDASRDATAVIGAKFGCNIYTSPTNVGKARVLDATIRRFDLCNRFTLVLFLDADSEIDTHYLENALPQFEDPQVAVLAGHVISRRPLGTGLFSSAIHYYRVRLYAMVQYLFKFGQTWKLMNVTFVAPGFASTYRSSVLKQLNITAPGLVIEDINMTIEVHRKKLGRVEYSPNVRCCTEDPANVRDYSKQVKRWTLGLWQAIANQGLWSSKFCVALVLGQIEIIFFSIFILGLPLFAAANLISGGHSVVWFPINAEFHLASPFLPLAMFIVSDIAMSVVVAIFLRDFWLLVFSPFFLLFRFIDAFWTLATIVMTFYVKSDGRWNSPTRYMGGKLAQ